MFLQKTKDYIMVYWARWRHKNDITTCTRGRHFLLGPGAADCAPMPLFLGQCWFYKLWGSCRTATRWNFLGGKIIV